MKINPNSQLAFKLLAQDDVLKTALLALQNCLEKEVGDLSEFAEAAKSILEKRDQKELSEINEMKIKLDETITRTQIQVDDLPEISKELLPSEHRKVLREWLFPKETKWFLIQESAIKGSKLVRVSEGYTARSLKDIKIGSYCYLLGKDAFLTMNVKPGSITGMYLNSSTPAFFRFAADLESGFIAKNSSIYDKEYAEVVQLLTYVELADVEVSIIEAGSSNGKTRAEGKIKNESDFRVYVVDSAWNKVIIRDSEFLVRGHYRLQPCGPFNKDRKLIWISDFAKHGYKRQARAKVTGFFKASIDNQTTTTDEFQ